LTAGENFVNRAGAIWGIIYRFSPNHQKADCEAKANQNRA